MSLVEQHLAEVWNLQFKKSSKLYLLPQGAPDEACFDEQWTRTSEFPVLGHTLSPDASIRECWRTSQKAMWRAFWGNCKNEHLRNNPERAMQLLQRSVYPVLAFKNSRWPPQKVISIELDRTQASMIASIKRSPPLPAEDPVHFCRRRMKEAHSIARAQATWKQKWFYRFKQWNDHLQRHPSHPTARLIRTRDKEWLMNRRASFAVQNAIRTRAWGLFAGRTDTRLNNGKVVQRWENGLDFAESSYVRNHPSGAFPMVL